MLPEICNELCVRPDVAAVHYPGQDLHDKVIRTHENIEHVEAVLQLAKSRGARYLVFDIRNFVTLSDKFVAISVKLWKELKAVGCRLILLCGEEYQDLLTFIKLDKVLSIARDEADLQRVLDADEADAPIYVACTPG
ncbi:MAG: hypothetical protein HY289_02775 [Planctomycetes bacterium]|nr:hypothetical protein [Planctomycetota bacterium]